VVALQLSADIIHEVETRTGRKIRILDIGGGFPVKYHPEVKDFKILAKKLNTEIKTPVSRRICRSLQSRADSLSPTPASWWQKSWERRCEMGKPVITSMTESTTRTPARFLTMSIIRYCPSRKARHTSPQSSAYL